MDPWKNGKWNVEVTHNELKCEWLEIIAMVNVRR